MIMTTSVGTGKQGYRDGLWLSLVACSLALCLTLPPSAFAQSGLPCATQTLATGDPLYPSHTVLVCIPLSGWNGQLIVYAHGYVAPQEALSLPTEELNSIQLPGGVSVVQFLVAQGFGFATSSYRKSGYAIQQGGDDLNALVAAVKAMVPPGSLKKTLLVGASEGGLVATMLLERFPQTYDGALVLAGPVGGAPHQIKFLGDFRIVFDYFFPNVFSFGAFTVPPMEFLNWPSHLLNIQSAITSNPDATRQLFKVTRAARDPLHLAETSVLTAQGILSYSIFGTNDLIQTAGGIPFENRLTLYLGADNTLRLNREVERIASNPAARNYLRQFYQTTGNLQRPLVALHTTLDPVVPFEHELIYAGLVALQGRLRHLRILPVQRYGHANFTGEELLGAFGLLLQQTSSPVSSSLTSLTSMLPEAMKIGE